MTCDIARRVRRQEEKRPDQVSGLCHSPQRKAGAVLREECVVLVAADTPRGEHVGTHGCEMARQPLRQLDDARLRGAVGGRLHEARQVLVKGGIGRDGCIERPDVHDRAAAPAQHCRPKDLRRDERAARIHVEHPQELVRRDVFETTSGSRRVRRLIDARVVHEHARNAELALDAGACFSQ
jgi:hypothetical protein